MAPDTRLVDSDLSPEMLMLGETLKGYELREIVGSGGQGTVYRAYQPIIDREVVVKMIRGQYTNHPEFIRRFESEAQVIARLEHLHIVPLYDFWREPNTAYLVLRWMRGGSLRSALRATGPWSLRKSARLIDQVASALNVAHRNLIVHRDLKPDNILLDDDHNAYLADFGIAKIIDPRYSDADPGGVTGTPDYMSPEQFLEKDITPQTDIYSLGIVLYELLTGHPPFVARSLHELALMHIRELVPPLQIHQMDLPAALNLVILRATAKDPADRYPDALSFAQAVRQIVSEFEPEQPTDEASADGSGRRIGSEDETLVLQAALDIQNPYKGLRAFQEGDAADFFGREKLVANLLAGFVESKEAKRFLALVGPSGSGKSSILRAGLVPLLRRGALPGSDKWFYSQIVPGSTPLTNLTEALLALASDRPENLSQQLRESEHGLLEFVNQLLPNDDSEYCLVVDQFEEIFTLVDDEAERLWFLNSLSAAVNGANSRVRVLISLRADFYDRPLVYSGFSDLIRSGTEVIVPLQAQELEYAIVGPARRVHLDFEPGLVSRIVADVNSQPGSLPLLQYALTELFERREHGMLTIAAYDAIRGVGGALGRRAEEIYRDLAPAGQQAVQKMMLRMVQISEDAEPTRARVLQAEVLALPGDRALMRDVMEQYGNFRLLTFDHHPTSRAPTIELAHEALISAWDRLKTWIAENGDLLRVQRQLSLAAQEWDKAGRDRSFLVSGARLAQFEPLQSAPTVTLSVAEQAYLKASIGARQAGVRRLRLFIGGLIAALILAFGLIVFAFQQRTQADLSRLRADEQAQLSRSRELSANAISHLDQLDLSVLLSLEALRVRDTFEARSSLLTGLETQPLVETFLPGVDAIRAVAFSPDGKRLATAGRASTVTLWDVDARKPVGAPLEGHTDWINSLAFSPDGKTLASASSDGTVRLWDAATGASVGQPLGDGSDSLWAVAFAPDGTLASAGGDGLVRLWNVKTGELVLPPLAGHEDVVYSLAFSPDGKQLASGSADTTVRLWDTATGDALHTFTDHTNWVLNVAFSPDGQHLASSGVDENIVIWNTQDDTLEAQFASGHTDYVRGLAYSADGSLLASSSQDGTIRLWDPAAQTLVGAPLTAHQDAIWGLAFRPAQPQTLVSAGVDGRTILWNLDAGAPLARTQIASTQPISSLTFAGDRLFYSSGNLTSGATENTGIHLWDMAQQREQTVLTGQARIITDMAYSAAQNTLVSASTDGSLFVWNLAAQPPSGVKLAQPSQPLSSVAFSPDGLTIASGDQAGTIQLWDAATGSAKGEPLRGHSDDILSLAFSPDGQTLASGSRDATIRLWTIDRSSASSRVLTGHQDAVSSVAFSRDGQTLVSGSYDGTVRLWDVETGQPDGQPLTGHTDEVWSVAFSPDGQMIASGGRDKTLRLWDVATHQALGRPLAGHTDWITHLAFSADGATVATGSLDDSVLLWDSSLSAWSGRACALANRSLTSDEWARYFAGADFHATCPAGT